MYTMISVRTPRPASHNYPAIRHGGRDNHNNTTISLLGGRDEKRKIQLINSI